MTRKIRVAVKILKEKKGIATKIELGGHEYALLPNSKVWEEKGDKGSN